MKSSYKVPAQVLALYISAVARAFLLWPVVAFFDLFTDAWLTNQLGFIGQYASTMLLVALYAYFVFPLVWKAYKMHRDSFNEWSAEG